MTTCPEDSGILNLHASCVALNGKGVLIRGPSGAGKSSLALRLMALGAELVSDDRTDIIRLGDSLIASAPEPLRGLIEARGVGVLRVGARDHVPLALVIDLDIQETDRLPPRRQVSLLGVPLDVVRISPSDHFVASIHCYLRGERLE